MKRPSAASLKRVTAENLSGLGAARLAEILVEVASTRADLKRRLRMELAAAQGAEHLLPEIDRRLSRLGSSRGAISWRQRPALVRDLDGLRSLIAAQLAQLDPEAAKDRIVTFLELSGRTQQRVRDKEGAVERVFATAAADAVALLARDGPQEAGARLAAAMEAQPAAWSRWAPSAVPADAQALARVALAHLSGRQRPGWTPLLRKLADVAGDPDAFQATFAPEAMRTPAIAAEVARRFLDAGRLEEARSVLESAVRPGLFRRKGAGGFQPDPAWEGVWIDYLERTGRGEAAQAARWAAFEQSLDLERAKDYVKRLADFDDVEAEQRIFEAAASFPDADRALDLLVAWPALREAAALVCARAGELRPEPEKAEAWARKLRRRHPQAAERLLRRAAAEAFRRREFATSTRLTEEADTIQP